MVTVQYLTTDKFFSFGMKDTFCVWLQIYKTIGLRTRYTYERNPSIAAVGCYFTSQQ